MTNLVAIIEKDVYGVRESFEAVAVDRSISFEREAEFALQALLANDYAMKIATSNRQSVINAVSNIAAIGISLNPAKKQAYLVPRDGRICLDISYMGLLDLAIASGSIRWGQAELVYKSDRFVLNGVDKPPIHERDPFNTERGEIVGVYVVVKTADGDYLTGTMSIADVHAIRDRSSAWRAWIEKKKKCPWVTDEGEMIKKTVIKRASKLWPKCERLDKAVHYLNTQGDEGLADIQQQQETPSNVGKGVIKPTDGAMALLDIGTQNYLRDLAEDVKEIFERMGQEATYNRIELEHLENDQMIALWSLLPSNLRSAMKREKKARSIVEEKKESDNAGTEDQAGKE
jgi:recombination protein RecT